HLEVEQRLAAEERQVHRWRVASLAEHEVDALAGCLFIHEARLGRALDDAILAVLVAVAAREIAFARHIEHERLQRNAALGFLGGRLGWWRDDRVARSDAE